MFVMQCLRSNNININADNLEVTVEKLPQAESSEDLDNWNSSSARKLEIKHIKYCLIHTYGLWRNKHAQLSCLNVLLIHHIG